MERSRRGRYRDCRHDCFCGSYLSYWIIDYAIVNLNTKSMKEILNRYKYPFVDESNGQWGITIEKENGGSSFTSFSTRDDALKALALSRTIQNLGIPLLVSIKIMRKSQR